MLDEELFKEYKDMVNRYMMYKNQYLSPYERPMYL